MRSDIVRTYAWHVKERKNQLSAPINFNARKMECVQIIKFYVKNKLELLGNEHMYQQQNCLTFR